MPSVMLQCHPNMLGCVSQSHTFPVQQSHGLQIGDCKDLGLAISRSKADNEVIA